TVLTVKNVNQQATRVVLTRAKSMKTLQCRTHLLLSILGTITFRLVRYGTTHRCIQSLGSLARKQYAANSRGVQRSGLAGVCLLCSGVPACAKPAHDRAVRCEHRFLRFG